MMQSLAEWKFGSGNVGDKRKKKQKVDYELHRPTAARLKKKQEDLLDLITALFKLALQSHRSADYKAVLDDSSITEDTTSLDQHKLFLLVIFVP